jgi:hypothetical protein
MDAHQFEPLSDLLDGSADFRPFAYYDKDLDAIRVQILDCPMYEERLDRILTVCKAVSEVTGKDDQIVGFAIKGVSHVLSSVHIEQNGAVEIAKLLDAIVKVYPSHSTKMVLEVFGSWPASKPHQVEFAAA